VDVPPVDNHQDVLVALGRADGQATCKVGRGLGKAMSASRQEWWDSRERQVEEGTRRVNAIT
jgi:hypothetical protein